MGGVWGVTSNWMYLIPVFGALFIGKKEIIGLCLFATGLMFWLALAHNQNPQYAIDLENINQLFDPFYTTKEVGKGTGLGLSLSKSFVQANGGDIYYELFNNHTSFVLEVPLN